ncbi:MAG: glycosyltransferase family 2 protein [Bacteroidota bacterium]
MTHISAVIITLNEERNISRCIESLIPVVDEIIIIDSFSTDNTKEICAKYPVKFLQKKWLGYSQTKNFGNSLAENQYILSIDADECLSIQLQEEILSLKTNKLHGVYKINRLTNYCGVWIYHSGWYPDWKIRLFPKDYSSWNESIVHEELEFSVVLPETKLLSNLEHYSYYSYAHHQEKADHYSRLTAIKYFKQSKKSYFLSPFLSAASRFISMYFIKLGVLDGISGYKIATISAKSNYLKYKELRKLTKNK